MVFPGAVGLELVAIVRGRRKAGADPQAREARREIADLRRIAGVPGDCRKRGGERRSGRRPPDQHVAIFAPGAVESAGGAQQVLAAKVHDVLGAVVVTHLQGAPAARELQPDLVGHLVVGGVGVDFYHEAVIQAVVRRAGDVELDLRLVDAEIPVMVLFELAHAGRGEGGGYVSIAGAESLEVLVDVVQLENGVAAKLPARRLGGGSHARDSHCRACQRGGSKKHPFHDDSPFARYVAYRHGRQALAEYRIWAVVDMIGRSLALRAGRRATLAAMPSPLPQLALCKAEDLPHQIANILEPVAPL